MIKLIVRFIIFVIISTLFLNTAVYFALNNAYTQKKIMTYINKNYLEPKGLGIDINYVNFDFFSRSIKINGTNFYEILDDGNHKNLFYARNITFLFQLFSSYIQKYPVLSNLDIFELNLALNYDKNGKLILPKIFNKLEKTSTENTKIKYEDIINKITNYIPKNILLSNINISLGEKNSNNYQSIVFDKVVFTKANRTITNRNPSIKYFVQMGKSSLTFPFLQNTMFISNFSSIGTYFNSGLFESKTIEFDSSYAQIKSSLHLNVNFNDIKSSQYQLNVNNLTVFCKEFFSALGLKSDGQVKVSGLLESNLASFPRFKGVANWQNLFLKKFDIYNGTGDILLKDKTVFYTNAKVTTYRKGSITSEGKFELFNTFNFQTTSKAQNVLFSELLYGLGKVESPVEATLSTNEIKVNGNILSKKGARSFEITASSLINADDLKVKAIDNKNRKKFPKININLALKANRSGIQFDNTQASIAHTPIDSHFSCPSGLIDFTPNAGIGVDIRVDSSQLEIADLNYFFPIENKGEASFTGRVILEPGSKNIQFISHFDTKEVSFLGANAVKSKGELTLTKSGGLVSKATAFLLNPNNSKSSKINMESFKFKFDNLESDLKGTATGNLSAIFSSAPKIFTGVVKDFDAIIDNLSFSLRGPLKSLKDWDFNLKSDLNQLSHNDQFVAKTKIALNCKFKSCEKSYLYLYDFSSGKSPSKFIPDSSFAAFKIFALSETQIDTDFKLVKVPLSFLTFNEKVVLGGSIYSNGKLKGPITKPAGRLDINIDNFKVNQINFGFSRVFYDSSLNENFVLNLSLFNNQIRANLNNTNENDPSKKAKLNVNFDHFDIAKIMASEARFQNNIFSSINGAFEFQGKIFDAEQNFQELLNTWSGSGKLNQSNIQFQDIYFNIVNNEPFVLNDGILKITNTQILSPFINIKTNGTYNLTTSTINIDSDLSTDLSKWDESLPMFDKSEGTGDGKINFTGNILAPNIFGNIKVKAKKLAYKNSLPEFSDLDGFIVFKNRKIEIQKFSAKKGPGTLDLTGTIDLPDASTNKKSPVYNLKLSSQNAYFKFKLPIINYAEIFLDSDLSLSGREIPYSIVGQVNIKKLMIFRDLQCNQIINEYKSLPKLEKISNSMPFANLNINVQALNSINVQTACLKGVFSTLPKIIVQGTSSSPTLQGGFATESGSLNILKSRFDIKKGEFEFTGLQKFNPNVDVQMIARVASYDIYWDIYGPLNSAKIKFSTQPQFLANGDQIIEPDIISMISTGIVPTQSSNANLISASTGVASLLGVSGFFDDTLDKATSTVTAGIFDSVSLVPTTQNGQLSWRLSATSLLSQKLSFGISYETGQSGNVKSAYGNYYLNKNVGLTGSFTSSAYVQQPVINEVFGGLRFNFGNNN